MKDYIQDSSITNSQILEKKLDILLTNLRYEQRQLAHWKSGNMSVTAVPGAAGGNQSIFIERDSSF